MSVSGRNPGSPGSDQPVDPATGLPWHESGSAAFEADEHLTTALPRPSQWPPATPPASGYQNGPPNPAWTEQPTNSLPHWAPTPQQGQQPGQAGGPARSQQPGWFAGSPSESTPSDHRTPQSYGAQFHGQQPRPTDNGGYREAPPSEPRDRAPYRPEYPDQTHSWSPGDRNSTRPAHDPAYPHDPGYPGGQAYPHDPGYPGGQAYPHNSASPGNPIYPADPGYPPTPAYPGDPAYPGGYSNAYPPGPNADANPPRRPPLRGAHLPPYQEPYAGPQEPAGPPASGPTPAIGGRSPRKLTVTRVAALRSRELTYRGAKMFHQATTADGADRSGLSHLTYAVMGNYAVDAALTVALANTIFLADTGSTGKVLSYLVITVAPFAVIAPFIGPLLDRVQSGRRLALAMSSFGRALLAIVMAFSFTPFNPWIVYPCALGNLVLSKAFSVLKSALTPRVLPEQITLVKTNSRLTVFGLVAGGVAGAVGAGFLKVTGPLGALFFTAACAIAGGVLCLRIPAWVESTEGEVPVSRLAGGTKRGLPLIVRATLWANSVIRVETGFLALFMAFVIKNQYPTTEHQHSAFTQLLLLGVVGAAAGAGGFVGNALGARLNLSAPEIISIISLAVVVMSTLVATVAPGLMAAALVGLIGSTASSLAKVCLDSVIQRELPEASRASAFGKTESVLQLSWVFGGVVGLLIGGVWFGHLKSVYSIGFGTITVILLLGLVQCWLMRSGKSMIPALQIPGRKGRPASSGTRSRSRSDQPTNPMAGADGPVRTTPGADSPARTPPSADGPVRTPPTKPAPGPAATKKKIRKAGSGR